MKMPLLPPGAAPNKFSGAFVKAEEDVVVEAELKPRPEYEVVLLVDNRELRTQQDRHYLYERLRGMGVRAELKSLSLGDFLWTLRIPRKQYREAKEEEAIEEDEGESGDPFP